MEILPSRIAPSVDIWTGASGTDTNWSDGANWSLGRAPGTGDIADFTNNSNVKNFTSTVDQGFTIAGLDIDSTWGGTINVNDPTNTTLAVTGNFTLASGNFGGNGAVTIAGTGSTWTGGTINLGSGGFTNTGTLTIDDSSTLALNSSGTLINKGTIDQSGSANLQIQNGATLDNQAGGSYDFTTDTGIQQGGGTPDIFSNEGTLEKTAGTGTSTINTTFDSSNAITVSSGTLALAAVGGASTGGTFTVSSGAILDLTGGNTVTYGGSYTGSGAGTVALSHGTLAIASGGASFDFSGSLFQWSGGTIDVTSGNLTNTGTLTLSNPNTIALNGTSTGAGTLINQGTINQSAAANLQIQNAATLDNQASGTYDFTTDTGIQQGGGTPDTFSNEGTLEKTGSSGGASTISTTFVNSNAINVTSGTLALGAAGGTSTGGTFTVGGGATLDLTGGATVFYTGTYTGSGGGTVAISHGTFAVAAGGATFNFPTGLLQWSGGTIDVSNGNLTDTGTLTLTNGAGNTVALNGGGTLINKGTINQSGGANLQIQNNATLDNQSAGIYDFTTDTGIQQGGGTPDTFTNEGILEKTGGTGTSTISSSFVNSNAIKVTSGTLALGAAGGTSTGGTFTVGSGATLDLTGGTTVFYTGTYTGSGAGTVALSGGTLAVASGGATFNFPSGLLQWSGGTIDVSSGNLTNASTGFITLTNPNTVALNGGGTLINKGTINQSGAANLQIQNDATLDNQSAGIYDFTTDTGIQQGGGTPDTFSNEGTLEKTGSSGGVSTISTTFVNSKNINVTSGTLALAAAGGTSTGGTFTVGSGATLDLTGGTTVFYTGTYTGSGVGTVAISHGTFAVAAGGATFNFPTGLLQWSGGTIDVSNGNLTNASTGFLTLSNGAGNTVALNGAGTLLNQGKINQSGAANLQLQNGATLDNKGTYDFTTDTGIQQGGGTPDTFVNEGTLEKTAGTGTSTISSGFDNSKAITVTSGTLALAPAGGASTGGTFTVSSGATLDLTGGTTVVYGGTYTGSGTGTVALSSGTLAVASGGATFNLAGNLFQWSGGTIDVSRGNLTNTGTLTLSNSGTVSLNGTGTGAGQLINSKTVTQKGTANLQIQNGATLTNKGTYDIITDTGIQQGGGTPDTFTNIGTLEKTAGTGTSTLSMTLNNTGTVKVSSGTLSITGAVTQVSGNTLTAGSWAAYGTKVSATLSIGSASGITTIGSKAKVTLSGSKSTFANLNGSSGLNSILAGGSFSILGGQTFTTAGNFSNAGSVILTSGKLNITGTVAQLSGTSLTGGTWTVNASSNLNFAAGSSITALAGAKVTLNGANSNFAALADLASIGSTSSFSLLGKRSFTTIGSFSNNGLLTVGPGSILTATGSFSQASTATLAVQMGGSNAAPIFGQVVSTTGPVALGGTLKLTSTVVPAVGSSFEIVNNQGSSSVSGTFSGLAEGSQFTVKKGATTMTFQITYQGGDGNDVVITRIS